MRCLKNKQYKCLTQRIQLRLYDVSDVHPFLFYLKAQQIISAHRSLFPLFFYTHCCLLPFTLTSIWRVLTSIHCIAYTEVLIWRISSESKNEQYAVGLNLTLILIWAFLKIFVFFLRAKLSDSPTDLRVGTHITVINATWLNFKHHFLFGVYLSKPLCNRYNMSGRSVWDLYAIRAILAEYKSKLKFMLN